MPSGSGGTPFFSLRWKIFCVVGAVVLLMGILSFVLGATMDRALRREHDAKGAALARGLAAVSVDPILIDSLVNLTSLLAEAQDGNPEIVYVFVVDRKGKPVASTFPGGIPADLLRIASAGAAGEGKAVLLRTEKGLVTDHSVPVMEGELGTLHLGLSRSQVEARIAATRKRGILVTSVFLVVGLCLSHALGAYFTRPLRELSDAAREFGEGHLDHRIVVSTRDEIGRLSATFNRMADDLQAFLVARAEAEEALQEAHDELERRVKERTLQLSAANQELEAFSYSVSHDLRAPLRGIDGFSLALLEDCSDRFDETGREYVRRIRNGCARMGTLIDDLLKLSRLTRGEMKRSVFDLSAVAASVARELADSAPERKAEFVVAPGLEVYGDPSLMRVALTNLLQNAWKFTRDRDPARIEFGAILRDGRQAFFVRDNGAGFDMRYAERLFGAFQRLHSNAEYEGTGIGLATVQRIVHRHGGDVWAEGEVGKGATFYFTLDREVA